MTPRVRDLNSPFAEVAGCSYLELHKVSGIYYVRTSVAGKGELFKSTRSKKKGEAKSIADEMIKEFAGQKPGLRAGRIKMAKICDMALEACLLEGTQLDDDGHPLRSKNTNEHDTYNFPLIKKLFGDYFADEIDEQFWKSWAKKEGRELNRTLGDIAKYLSKALSYAFEEKYLARKPRIKNPDKQRNKAKVYDNAQIITFYHNAEPDLQHLIILGAENPLRPHENCEVEWSMVSFEKDEKGKPVVIYRFPEWFTKTREAREMTLSPRSAEILRARYKTRDKSSPYVFPSPKNPATKPLSKKMLSRMWARMKERAGIPTAKIKFHWLRHSFYSKALLEALVPVALVSEAGGTSIATLQARYLKSTAQTTRAVSHAVDLFGGEEE
jgi:integrase